MTKGVKVNVGLGQTALLIGALAALNTAQACWEEAGHRYEVNARLLYAIARTESSLNSSAFNRNSNGSYDIGLMQINSSWLPELKRYGIDAQSLRDPCTNIHVGAWLLAQNFRALGPGWEAVGAYNATSPHKRMAYAWKVYRNLKPEAVATTQR